jgi:hypothetical protein
MMFCGQLPADGILELDHPEFYSDLLKANWRIAA